MMYFLSLLHEELKKSVDLFMAKHTRGARVRVKTRCFERKRFKNTRSILLTLTPAMCWGLD
jgi:hypothetical protein